MVNPIFLRRCCKCKEKLPLASFPRSKKGSGGYASRCKTCRERWIAEHGNTAKREARLWRMYGITQKDYDRIFAKQQGRCAICLTDKPGGPWGVLAVDHCHDTGKVRGLLCTNCNFTLGRIGDDLQGLQRFADYLNLAIPPYKIGKLTKPRLKSIVRYVDAKGCRCTKDTPGARAVSMKTQSYYAKIGGRWVPLKTTDPVTAQAILDRWRTRSGQPPEQPELPPPGLFSAF